MGDDTEPKTEPAAEKAPARGSSAKESARYSVDDLRENPRLLGTGISRHALAGALAGQTKKTFTIDEASKLVDRFLKAEPKSDGDA